MTRILLTALVAVALGFVATSSQPALAGGEGIAIVIMPPTLNTGDAPYLTQGYHSSPQALDWDDSPSNQKVFIRTFGIADYSTPTNIALAVGTDTTSSNPCKTTLITFYEAGTWVVEGKIKWWHTLPLSENINKVIHGDDTWAHLDDKHMADTVDTFKCAATAAHVHETFESVDDRNTDLYPTSATCEIEVEEEDCDYFENDDIANWTMIVSW